MDRESLKARFLAGVKQPTSIAQIEMLAARCAKAKRKASAEDRIDIAAALAHTAFLAPDQTGNVYDALSHGWRGEKINSAPVMALDRAPETVPDGLWESYWTIVEDGLAGKLDALSITQRTAALGEHFTDPMARRVAEMSHAYPGVTKAASGDLPAKIKLETLAACPQGSLGQQFHRLIVDNQFDLEVLDRAEIGLADLPTPLDYLNTRILQAHDLWHITAGYETTALHEIAISAFQMAQFGHNYSAQFLSITGVVGALSPAYGYRILLDTITSAWVHGRQTAPLMTINWEAIWHKPVETIRDEYGITVYDRPHPANLIERSRPVASFIEKISRAFQNVFRRRAATST